MGCLEECKPAELVLESQTPGIYQPHTHLVHLDSKSLNVPWNSRETQFTMIFPNVALPPPVCPLAFGYQRTVHISLKHIRGFPVPCSVR